MLYEFNPYFTIVLNVILEWLNIFDCKFPRLCVIRPN